MSRLPAPTPATAATSGMATRATNLYDQLRCDLLDGTLEPGSKLAIEALAERYATSATPLREALNRLISDGLVERREQRGFVVAGISAEDLAEITKTRCWLEEIALRESIAAHRTEWEEALVLAHHRLARTPRSLSDSHFENNPEWEPLHRAFHRALIGGCGSRWLLGFCDQLADQHHRYRRLSAPRAFAKRGVKSEHQQLMEAAIEGRADEAVALLRQHFERTARIIREDPGLFAGE
ncbi:MAG: GntR family transcriptional regulator [Burkholderiaceae bacterium]|nr:GntR family transcriptional regulator [Burkholderiaceae bacterium]